MVSVAPYQHVRRAIQPFQTRSRGRGLRCVSGRSGVETDAAQRSAGVRIKLVNGEVGFHKEWHLARILAKQF